MPDAAYCAAEDPWYSVPGVARQIDEMMEDKPRPITMEVNQISSQHAATLRVDLQVLEAALRQPLTDEIRAALRFKLSLMVEGLS